MPISVPASPKVFTTKYANFRGVDYTNDASNVWYRRSPTGVNMLPDLSGHPYKRYGWKIEFTPKDFCDAAGISPAVDVTQFKVDYFELGGKEYLFFHTSLGCFYYADTLTFISKSYEYDEVYYYSKSQTYNEGDFCEYTSGGRTHRYKCTQTGGITVPEAFTSAHWTEVDEDDCWKSFPPTGASVDYRKAFFFEGGGQAAYYLFAGGKMYYFDGVRLNEAHPYIPTVLTMCDTNGAGELLYEINMLTEWRAVGYTCDGTSTAYTVPNGFEEKEISGTLYPVGIQNIYLTDANGNWVVTDNWTATNGVVTFNTAPPQTLTEQDNMLIVYRTNAEQVVDTVEVTSDEALISFKRVYTERVPVKYRGSEFFPDDDDWVDDVDEQTEIETSTTYEAVTNADISLSNLDTTADTYLEVQTDKDLDVWERCDIEHPKLLAAIFDSVNSYGTSASVHFWHGSDDQYADMLESTASSMFGITNPLEEMYNTYPNSHSTVETREVSLEDVHIMEHFGGGGGGASFYYEGSGYRRTTVTTVKTYKVRLNYMQLQYEYAPNRSAYFSASKALVYGNGIINQVFLTATSAPKFNTRVWYSIATNPLYFPDTNYIEVGATDKKIMGLIKVGDYLGIIKQGGATDTSVYLAYPTSFEDITTYAVKQSVNGIGAVSNGAFNIINDEPLFLSSDGVMGIEPTGDDERKIRNRSYYINAELAKEGNLNSAFSFVFKNMYWLGINNKVYVLDGSQKSSWENEKTNLQYECYVLNNIPAKSFAKKDGKLWFIDKSGNVCRFKGRNDDMPYVDEYYASVPLYAFPIEHEPTYIAGSSTLLTLDDADVDEKMYVGGIVKYESKYYTIYAIDDEHVTVRAGVPIRAVWGTIADDDGSAHYYKTLQKKGSIVALMPMSNNGVRVHLIKDEDKPILVGETSAGEHTLPFSYYLRKKIKKYKRLQIVCENNTYNCGFGVDEIIKSYTIGNYAKK